MAAGDAYQHVAVTGVASTVTVPAGTRVVEVLNRSGGGAIYASTDGTTPTVGGNFPVIPAAIGAALLLPMAGDTATVKLIASANTDASVTVVD